MDSKVMQIYAYTNVDLSSFLVPFQVDELKIAQEMKNQENRYSKWENGTQVHRGDIVVYLIEQQKQEVLQKYEYPVIVFDGYAGEVMLSRKKYNEVVELLKNKYARISL